MSDYITGTRQDIEELHALVHKCSRQTYPRVCGDKLEHRFGGGRHITVTVTEHVAIEDNEDGSCRLCVTPLLKADLAYERVAMSNEKQLTNAEYTKLDNAVKKAKPVAVLG